MYKKVFAIEDKKSVLEIGCGPGALSQALHRWYPNASLHGTDRDSTFVKFAGDNAPGIVFTEADATALPFNDNSFDVTISHTVQEHIETEKFFSEQFRVLSTGGVCLVLSVRSSINHTAPVIAFQSEFETDMLNKTEKYFFETDKKYGVAAFSMNEQKLPLAMSKYGFRNVSTHYIAISLTPDNADVDYETGIAIINANRQVKLDGIEYIRDIAPEVLTTTELAEWQRLTSAKYDKRIEQLKDGEKQWDTQVTMLMVIRGEK